MSLHNALSVKSVSATHREYVIYRANVSKEWSIGGIPQGGYAVGIILSAAGDLQSRSLHPDAIHLTAHFLQPVDVADCEVRVKLLRSGKKLTNVEADLIQNGKTKIATRIIYGVLPDLTKLPSSSSDVLTLTPPSPYARRIPFSRHPSLMTPDAPNDKYLRQIKAEHRFFEERNAVRAERQASGASGASHDCGLEWGAWFELKDSADVLEAAMMPFFADCMRNLPSLLPRKQRPGPSWFATVVLTVEFKSKIPSSISNPNPNTSHSLFSPRTVGIYSSARFMTEGRHDEYVEVWTAPSTIGGDNSDTIQARSGKVDPDWHEKQVCLAISTQMALTIPEENSRRSRL